MTARRTVFERGGAPLARRRSPLRWRVILGAALVTAAAGGVVFAHRAAQQPPTTQYLVLTADVPAGEAVDGADLGAVALDLPGAVDAVPTDAADQVLGRIASHTLNASGLLRESDLLAEERFVSPDEIEFAVSLDPARVPLGAFGIGDVVHLLATSGTGGTTELTSHARVTGIGDDTDDGVGGGSRVRLLLTVPDLAPAAAAVDASVNQELTIVLPAPGIGGTK